MRSPAARGTSLKTALLFASFFSLHCWAATVNGTIQGAVVDDSGRPVGGARIFIGYALPSNAAHFAAPPVITGGISATVTADAAGAFRVDAIRAGNYIACAQTLA